MGLEVLSMKFAFYPVNCRQGEWDEGQKGEGTHLKTVGIIHNSFQRVVGKREFGVCSRGNRRRAQGDRKCR